MYIETQEPAICQNQECDDYQAWEEYEFKEAKHDGLKHYYICRSCGKPIYV